MQGTIVSVYVRNLFLKQIPIRSNKGHKDDQNELKNEDY